MSDLTARCSVCKTKIKELPTYEYCDCPHCEGHIISGVVMGCEHVGAIDVQDIQKTLIRYRGGALDDIIRSYKEDAKRRKASEEAEQSVQREREEAEQSGEKT